MHLEGWGFGVGIEGDSGQHSPFIFLLIALLILNMSLSVFTVFGHVGSRGFIPLLRIRIISLKTVDMPSLHSHCNGVNNLLRCGL